MYVENPDLVDSLEGLARWRLLEDLVQRHVNETSEALRWLVDQGYLETIGGRPGVQTMYRLNAERSTDAKRLVAGPAKGAARGRTGRRR